MYKLNAAIINAVFPATNVSTPKEIVDNLMECYQHLSYSDIPVGDTKLVNVGRGKGYKYKFIPLGLCKSHIKRDVIYLSGEISSVPENKPYIQLTFNLKNNYIDPESLKFVFVENPASERDPKYTVTEIGE